MAGEVYSVQIKLDVDSSQLDAAEARMRGMQGAGGTAGGRRGVSPLTAAGRRHRRQGLTDGQRDFVAGATRFSRNYPYLLNASPMRRGLASINRALSTLSYDFSRNLFSINGFRRNLGNFTNVLTQTGGALINAVPALKSLSAGLASFVAVRGAGLAVGGLAMLAGKKVLMGENLGQAATNIMQFNAARMGLGAGYDEVYRRGSEMAATYGYSRAGVIQTANVMSGLHVNGGELGIDKALQFAGIAGKLAQTSGLDYNRVALNLQQLIGQPTTNARDLRELIGQSPLIAKIAQQKQVARTGTAGDVREFLKDKTTLLDVLYEFDKQIQAHPIMKLRGAVTLSKENLWIGIAENGVKFFEDVSGGVTRFNEMLQRNISRYMASYNSGALNSMFDDFTNTFSSIMDGVVNIVPKLVKAISWANENIWTLSLAVAGLRTGNPLITAAGVLAGMGIDGMNKEQITAVQNKTNYATAEVKKGLRNAFMPKYQGDQSDIKGAKNWATEQVEKLIPYPIIDSIVNATPIEVIELKRAGFGRPNYTTAPTGNTQGMDFSSVVEKYTRPAATNYSPYAPDYNLNTDNSGVSDSYGESIKAMAGERRSLTINFNREIVNMPTNITATDIANLEAQIRPMMEEVVTSGLNRALAAATVN